ncbi:MAG: transglutaminase domain-containing protein [Eubacteriales bacterium]|nr:transglutaminase domain-containing protein [Eubacteriales bacterium]
MNNQLHIRNRMVRWIGLLTVVILLQSNIFGTSANVYAWGEPAEVTALRNETEQEDESIFAGHWMYYYKQLSDKERKVYREMLASIQNFETEFYVTSGDTNLINRSFMALLYDHPELFWVHNKESFYTESYSDQDYAVFTPHYTYNQSEASQIQNSIEQAYQDLLSRIPSDASDYDKAMEIYVWIVDHVSYVSSMDDQNIAGSLYNHEAVCAGYASAFQYFAERLDIPVIYVSGDFTRDDGSTEGHAWNIITLGGENYYVDVTNGDQPDFFAGASAQLEEHKTTMIDYLCPFPEEYEAVARSDMDFAIPECTSHDLNFYVKNQASFSDYDYQTIYDFCKMRIDNGAAVVRFKFATDDAFQQALSDWQNGSGPSEIANYYMEKNGLTTINYYSGVLKQFKTFYFMF